MAAFVQSQSGAMENSCAALLTELQLIWDELGEIDADRDKQLLAIEEECLQVYKRKVDEASRYRVELQAAVADSEKEVITICTQLGEKYEPMEGKLGGMPLRQQMAAVQPRIEKLRALKFARVKEFAEVLGATNRLNEELFGEGEKKSPAGTAQDLTKRRLEELRTRLEELQEEKAKRLDTVLAHVKRVHSLCSVLGEDFADVIYGVHPSLKDAGAPHNKSVSSETLRRLEEKMASLLEEKKRRMQKASELGAFLVELWSLLDTPQEEQKPFTEMALSIAMTEGEITREGALSLATLQQADDELTRLGLLKSGRMKELVAKKRRQLEEICETAHMQAPTDTTAEKTDALIEAEMIDASELLAKIERQIEVATADKSTRAPVSALVEKFVHAVEQEQWLEDFEKDENRYNNGRGGHIQLKRAEVARTEVKKIGPLSDALLKAAATWERENGRPFFYDQERVQEMVEMYRFEADAKVESLKRQKEAEKIQKQQKTVQEIKFGSIPVTSPHKKQTPMPTSARKVPVGSTLQQSTSVNRRLSMGGACPDRQPPTTASRSNLGGLLSPVKASRAPSNFGSPAGSAQSGRKRTGNGTPGVTSRPVQGTPSKLRKVPIAPKPRPAAPANFVALAMAGPPPAAPESPPHRVASPPATITPVLMERNFSGLALNVSGSPVKQADKEGRQASRLGDRDIPPAASSSPGGYSDDVVITGNQARSADRYDSDSDSDAPSSEYDDENDDSMPLDGKTSPALRTSAERAPFSQLNLALEHARISDPLIKAPSPALSGSPQLGEERRLSMIPERRASMRY